MTDPGYVNYQDSRLQPPEPPEDAVDLYCDCAHAEACRRQLARQRGWDESESHDGWKTRLAADLGCEDCDLHDVNESLELRCACRRLAETVRVAEGITGMGLLDSRMRHMLLDLGIEV